jgi:hypothetical protein
MAGSRVYREKNHSIRQAGPLCSIIYPSHDSQAVKCDCSFSLEFENAETAKRVLDSVRLDNGEWISSKLKDNKIMCEASSNTIGGLLHTAEDFLACVALAEKMMKKKCEKSAILPPESHGDGS